MTPKEYYAFLRTAFDDFLEALDSTNCQPDRHFLPYDTIKSNNTKWPYISNTIIQDELRELTNNLNSWLNALKRWHAWLVVSKDHSENNRWELEWEFITPIATYCLFQPSAIRDTLTFVVTNGMHQARLAADKNYKDCLPLDRNPWDAPYYPTRRAKEHQLQTILNTHPDGKTFLDNLRRLDDKSTRAATLDFRNLASHSIAPRFSIGVTRLVTRRIEQATRMEQKKDGFFYKTFIPNETTVCYTLGGTSPLDFDHMFDINLKQFDIAVSCFNNYIDMLNRAISELPSEPD